MKNIYCVVTAENGDIIFNGEVDTSMEMFLHNLMHAKQNPRENMLVLKGKPNGDTHYIEYLKVRSVITRELDVVEVPKMDIQGNNNNEPNVYNHRINDDVPSVHMDSEKFTIMDMLTDLENGKFH